jgi:hypothetical protein
MNRSLRELIEIVLAWPIASSSPKGLRGPVHLVGSPPQNGLRGQQQSCNRRHANFRSVDHAEASRFFIKLSFVFAD